MQLSMGRMVQLGPQEPTTRGNRLSALWCKQMATWSSMMPVTRICGPVAHVDSKLNAAWKSLLRLGSCGALCLSHGTMHGLTVLKARVTSAFGRSVCVMSIPGRVGTESEHFHCMLQIAIAVCIVTRCPIVPRAALSKSSFVVRRANPDVPWPA